MSKKIVIVGAAGQAREVEWAIRDLNAVEPRYDFVGYVVSDTTKLTQRDSHDRVLGDYDWLVKHRGRVDCIALGIGTPAARLKVAAEIEKLELGLSWPTLIHPTAIFDASTCRFGRGVFVSAGVVMTVNVEMSDFSMANFGCTVGHESRIGNGCVVNPGANISGGVTLEEGVLVGTGAQVLQYLTVHTGAQVGAGAVVTKDVAAGATVIGIPAKPLQEAVAG